MLIEDFSIETSNVEGYPIQAFKKRFSGTWELFHKSAAMYKDDIFLIEGQDCFTFGQAAEMAVRLATILREKSGVDQGNHVGILMENSIRFIISFWAIQNLGATAVIFNTRLTIPELMRQLQFSDLKVLLTSTILSEKVQAIPSHKLDIQTVILGDDWLTELPAPGQTPLPHGVSEDDTAIVLFTSGTSGTPKGVMLTHRNIITCAFKSGATISLGIALALSKGITLGPTSEESTQNRYLLIAAPLFHIMALEQMLAAVFLGQGSILVPSFNPQEIMEMINRGDIYGLTGTPTMYWLLLNKTSIRRMKVDSIRRLGFGAAPMPPDLIKDLREVFPSARLRNGYGMTEAPSISAMPDMYIETHLTSVG